MKRMGIQLGVLLAVGGAAACTGRPVARVSLSLAQPRVTTAAEARAIALQEFTTDSARAPLLRLDAVEVDERPAEWWVYIPSRTSGKPAGASRVVDKQTGTVRIVVAL